MHPLRRLRQTIREGRLTVGAAEVTVLALIGIAIAVFAALAHS